jgi:hypothetical protein
VYGHRARARRLHVVGRPEGAARLISLAQVKLHPYAEAEAGPRQGKSPSSALWPAVGRRPQ